MAAKYGYTSEDLATLLDLCCESSLSSAQRYKREVLEGRYDIRYIINRLFSRSVKKTLRKIVQEPLREMPKKINDVGAVGMFAKWRMKISK